MSSLQDQLLKAGLVSKDKATKAKSAKRKQAKISRKHKIEQEDQSKLEAQKTIQEQAEKARALNQEKNAIAEQKAITAQIKQLIESNTQSLGKPAVSFNFSDNGAIKSLEVSNQIHRFLSNGRLGIVKLESEYKIVVSEVYNKIKERDDEYLVLLNDNKVKEDDTQEEDDPYADYQIPDDLMW